nr:unnamed protein product [Callosobruchus chinensis]
MPVCRAAAHILAARMQKAVILRKREVVTEIKTLGAYVRVKKFLLHLGKCEYPPIPGELHQYYKYLSPFGGVEDLIPESSWARAHQDWLLPQWKNVLFSDESRFGLVSDDYRKRVWRERGGQNRLETAIEHARSTQELIFAATEEWDNIPQEVIDNLIVGMRRRVDALIRSRGGNTKY